MKKDEKVNLVKKTISLLEKKGFLNLSSINNTDAPESIERVLVASIPNFHLFQLADSIEEAGENDWEITYYVGDTAEFGDAIFLNEGLSFDEFKEKYINNLEDSSDVIAEFLFTFKKEIKKNEEYGK